MCFQVERGLEKHTGCLVGLWGSTSRRGRRHWVRPNALHNYRLLQIWDGQVGLIYGNSRAFPNNLLQTHCILVFFTGFLKRLFHINLVRHLQAIHLPPPWSACTDFQILLPVLKLLSDSRSFFPCQKSVQNPTHPLSNVESSGEPRWPLQPPALPVLYLCLPSMNAMGAEGLGTSWKAPKVLGEQSAPPEHWVRFSFCKLRATLSPRMAHPFLISKCSIVNTEQRFLLTLFFSI